MAKADSLRIQLPPSGTHLLFVHEAPPPFVREQSIHHDEEGHWGVDDGDDVNGALADDLGC